MSHRLVTLIAVATILLAACGGATAPAAAPTPSAPQATVAPATAAPVAATSAGKSSGPRTKVRTGYVPVLIYAPLYIAIEKGYFADEGLDIELSVLQGGSDLTIPLAAGQVEVIGTGAGAQILNAAKQGAQFKIVAPLHGETKPVATPLVVSKKAFDSGKYTKVSDLKGKKVSVNAFGAATEYWLAQALKQGGLTFKDIDFQAVAFNDVPAALESGVLDAGMLGEPLATSAEQKGLIHRLSEDFLDNFQVTMMFYNIPFSKTPAADAFLRAYLKGCRDMQGDGWKDDTNAKIIEKYTKVPADVIKISRHPIFYPNGDVNLKDLQTLQDFFLTRGTLLYKEPIDIASYVDSSFAQRAVKVLGEYKVK